MGQHEAREGNRGAHGWWLTVLLLSVVQLSGCARLPYTTRVLHEDPRISVLIQHEVAPAGYSHPVQFSQEDVRAILSGFSIREQKRLPLRWFAEETPPKKLFREDQLDVLSPYVAEALRVAGPEERIAFAVYDPGLNPRYERSVTAGWLAVRDPLFLLTIEYFQTQQPLTKFSPYDPNYPTPPSEPGSYVLYFEPGRYWVLDQPSKKRGVEYRAFLKSMGRLDGR